MYFEARLNKQVNCVLLGVSGLLTEKPRARNHNPGHPEQGGLGGVVWCVWPQQRAKSGTAAGPRPHVTDQWRSQCRARSIPHPLPPPPAHLGDEGTRTPRRPHRPQAGSGPASSPQFRAVAKLY